MLRRTLIPLLLLATAGAVFGDAFRWVDENGVVQYSDRPQPGAERIEIASDSPRQTPAPRTASSAPQQADAPPAPADTGYESLNVASPGAEETLWNLGGTLDVILNLQPALRQGDQVRVYFDGKPQMVAGTSFQIAEVYRGVHNIQAEVIDQAGQLKVRSRTNRFYVQQNTVITRQRPRN